MNYDKLANPASLQKTMQALTNHRYEVMVVKNGSEALEEVKKAIPRGASIMNGSSTTLEQIGYHEYLKSGNHPWVDLHANISAEDDKEKRDKLRKESVLSDYYLGSVHALIENGEFIIASNSGSQLPHIVYTSPNLIFVVSTKKIVPTVDAAMKRLEKHVVPLEDKRMMAAYNMHTGLNKLLIFKGEAGHSTRKIYFILVEENLGF
ncbi:lactate utilization protein [Candidatus Roizmanbacteria bacterium]|nr:lactate utilization protein [Candidatus Roizmanbacteria bacterium]